jgi:hypothetical protein
MVDIMLKWSNCSSIIGIHDLPLAGPSAHAGRKGAEVQRPTISLLPDVGAISASGRVMVTVLEAKRNTGIQP